MVGTKLFTNGLQLLIRQANDVITFIFRWPRGSDNCGTGVSRVKLELLVAAEIHFYSKEIHEIELLLFTFYLYLKAEERSESASPANILIGFDGLKIYIFLDYQP